LLPRRPIARVLGIVFLTQSSIKSPYPIAPGDIPRFLASASHPFHFALYDSSGRRFSPAPCSAADTGRVAQTASAPRLATATECIRPRMNVSPIHLGMSTVPGTAICRTGAAKASQPGEQLRHAPAFHSPTPRRVRMPRSISSRRRPDRVGPAAGRAAPAINRERCSACAAPQRPRAATTRVLRLRPPARNGWFAWAR
jgi:hypothetical protein